MPHKNTDEIKNVVKYLDYRIWLQKEYSNRVRNNPRYSLRSFSKLLDMDPSSVSQILSGKRNISSKILNKICDSLSVGPEKRSLLIASLGAYHAAETYVEVPAYGSISAESFSPVSDWYHAAILEMTFIKNFKVDRQSISRALKVSEVESGYALERLKKLDLLFEKNNQLIKRDFFLSNESSPGITSFGHKEFQRQLIQKALVSIDDISR